MLFGTIYVTDSLTAANVSFGVNAIVKPITLYDLIEFLRDAEKVYVCTQDKLIRKLIKDIKGEFEECKDGYNINKDNLPFILILIDNQLNFLYIKFNPP